MGKSDKWGESVVSLNYHSALCRDVQKRHRNETRVPSSDRCHGPKLQVSFRPRVSFIQYVERQTGTKELNTIRLRPSGEPSSLKRDSSSSSEIRQMMRSLRQVLFCFPEHVLLLALGSSRVNGWNGRGYPLLGKWK